MSALPVFRWHLAPDGSATRRQLRARGLRPGGQDVAGTLERPRRRGRPPLIAYLYRVDLAKPVRPMTAGRWRAHAAMMRARRTCSRCCIDVGYCVPRAYGICGRCLAAEGTSEEIADQGGGPRSVGLPSM